MVRENAENAANPGGGRHRAGETRRHRPAVLLVSSPSGGASVYARVSQRTHTRPRSNTSRGVHRGECAIKGTGGETAQNRRGVKAVVYTWWCEQTALLETVCNIE